ncbi:MAG: NAD(P)/FAD-dependent oxidoreductase, partial [Anaerolineae bacterium]
MRFVIAGGGVAGITAAMDLARRELGEVVVYSDEEYPYYYRPQLTEFLAGNLTMSRLLRRPLSWYEERGIQLKLGQPVTAVDTEHKVVTVDGQKDVPYDKLLLAMGSLPWVPPIKGADKHGVLTWRTLEDTLEMEKAAISCHNVVVIGGGLLGLEASRGLKTFCARVTVVEFFPRLMPRQLDAVGARLLQDFVEGLGIEVFVGARTEEIEGNDTVTGVRLHGGEVLPTQTVVCATGVRPNDAIAEAAGIEVDRGVVVDDHMATSAPDVYAAGDIAVYKGYSWAIAPIAQAQSRVAAANMAGEEKIYDVVVPSTTLKVVGIDVSSVGLVNPTEEDDERVEVRHLDKEAGTYKKVVLRDEVIVGSIVINDRQLARELENKIA